ncbi:hypothetical protein, partial [Staphylococcus epidermidis]|uniref:hypothetical protein n=1 Tax=Staphylococcus epidermidis TaxID=1282 RepID=UPI001C9307ED
FKSSHNHPPRLYTHLNHIPHHIPTPLNVQQILFPNTPQNTRTPLPFTTNPLTPQNHLFPHYLLNPRPQHLVPPIPT